VSLQVYDITGQMIRRLVAEEQPACRCSVVWDGRDQAGNSAASGVYLYVLEAGDFRDIRRMALMK